MKILLINLDRSSDRLSFQTDQFRTLGVEFERLPAVNASDIPQEYFEKHQFDWQRPISITELACVQSHALAWQKCLELEEAVLILEDDCVFSTTLPRVLASLENQPKGVDRVNLETRVKKKLMGANGRSVEEGANIHSLWIDKGGAACYVLYPSGAKKLLQKQQTYGWATADAFIGDLGALKNFQLMPAVAVQFDVSNLYYGLVNIPSEFVTKRASTIVKSQLPKYQWNWSFIKMRLKRSLQQVRLFGNYVRLSKRLEVCPPLHPEGFERYKE